MVDLSAARDWWLDYSFVRDFYLYSGPDSDAVQTKHNELLATYGPYSPPWLVTFEARDGYYLTLAEFRVRKSRLLDEPTGWEPPPLTDIEAYRPYFQTPYTVLFAYPEPEGAMGTFSVREPDIPDLQQFTITAVERRKR